MRIFPSALIALLIWLLAASPVLALVEPEVESWQQLVKEVESLPGPLGSLLGEALNETGGLAGEMASAPLASLMSELELRRGLKFKYFTPWHVKNRKDFRRFIARELAKEYTPEKALQEEAVLKALGLVPLDFKIVPFMEDLLTDSVAGVYDPSTDQFFLVDMASGQRLTERLQAKALTQLTGDTTSTIIIHELDHALGGQHFPLREVYERLTESSYLDERLAVQALVEGDATFVMFDHQQKNPAEQAGEKLFIAGMDRVTDILMSFPLPLPGMAKFSEAPLFFQKSLIFPYYTGAEFVSETRHAGVEGWSLVDGAYINLPHSTEQIFHPNRYMYLVRKPSYPDFSKIPEPFGDWQTVRDERGGEFLLRVVLEQYGVDNYREAADGWHGDTLRVYRHKKTGALGFYWVIRWDNAKEAGEFFNSLGAHLPFQVEQESTATIISLAFDKKQLQTLRKAIGKTI